MLARPGAVNKTAPKTITPTLEYSLESYVGDREPAVFAKMGAQGWTYVGVSPNHKAVFVRELTTQMRVATTHDPV